LKQGGTTLKETGRHIFRALVHNVLKAATDGTAVEWGVNTPWAWVHQVGALLYHRARKQTIYRKVSKGALLSGFVKRSKSNFATEHQVGNYAVLIPARPFIGIDAQDQADISDILARHLAKALKGGAA
jgi:phage gpG-like protein